MTRHNQPYAKVINTPGSDEWTIDASHATLEMFVDPYGNRLQASTAIEIVGGGASGMRQESSNILSKPVIRAKPTTMPTRSMA
jgi:hypothetical protein